MRGGFRPIALFVLLGGTIALAEEPELDPLTGFKMTGDWEIVRNNCISCHSPKLITQQRGDAAHWLNMIRWMQEQQNLWQFDPETEKKIVGYLAENYAPDAGQRRSPIPPHLMPPNPFEPKPVDSPETEPEE
jgi:hypothetical protein